MMPADDPLALFSPAVRAWFASTFPAPSLPQHRGWPAIARGEHTLITAPTGSGKTLAAFLFALDQIARNLQIDPSFLGVHTLYISPLKALSYDVDRNLRAPLDGIRETARVLGEPAPTVRAAVRTGDTPQAERQAMLRQPPHVLITTPESLFILLTHERARIILSRVRQVIVDEVHALLDNKRGANLALCLERLEALCQTPPVRIGLSATVRPLSEAATFLGGLEEHEGEVRPRPVTIVDCGMRKSLDVQVLSPVQDFSKLPENSIWPSVLHILEEQVSTHRSTLVFVRMRAQAERITRALCERAGRDLAMAHHSAVAAPVRRAMEEQLKAGELPALVSTGTMELGIDVGAIDLVVQVGSPGQVSRALQRVGRAGHLLTEKSQGRLLPLHREDLVECTVVARAMLDGAIETSHMIGSALDVLGQHLLSELSMSGPRQGEELFRRFGRAAPYRGLGRPAFDAVLRLLSGRYPAEVARGLVAKLNWEQQEDRLTALSGARLLCLLQGGTIPDQGYYRLVLADGTRLGELEEEFVYERRVGDALAFASKTWRILEIGREQVVVAPAPGVPAVIPFWKGGQFGRDAELSQAIGEFREALYARADDPDAAAAWLEATYPVDAWAAKNLAAYVAAQRQAGQPIGTHRQLVLESFLDDLGDPVVVLHSLHGNRVNAPLGMALRRQLRTRLGLQPQILTDDNAVLIRMPDGDLPPPLDMLSHLDPETLTREVQGELQQTPLFGALFRQNAGRFMVLGTRGLRRRNPLWLQRLRAKDLDEVTRDIQDFPVRVETLRECMHERFDLSRLLGLARGIRSGEVTVLRRQSRTPSPVAAGVLNRFMAIYMYEYDQPRAERALAELGVSEALWHEVPGLGEGKGFISADAAARLEARWQGLSEGRRARDAEELVALVVRLGLIPEADLVARSATDPGPWIEALVAAGRLIRIPGNPGQGPRICVADDRLLVECALEVRLESEDPTGARTPGESEPLGLSRSEAQRLLLLRVLGELGPVRLDVLSQRTGLSEEAVATALEPLVVEGRVIRGAFVKDSDACHVLLPHNLKALRQGTVHLARAAIQPVDPARLQQLVLRQQHLGPAHMQSEAALPVVLSTLLLRPLPAAALETDLLPGRLEGYQPRWLDDLIASGELGWTGHGPRRIRLFWRDQIPRLRPGDPELSPEARTVQETLARLGASFLPELLAACPLPRPAVQAALWELVWAGLATNDRLDSLRRGLHDGFQPPPLPSSENPLTGRPSSFAPRRGRWGKGPRPLSTALTPGPWSGRFALLPSPATPTESVEERLTRCIEEHLSCFGLLCREFLAEQEGPTFSTLYPLLCRMELRGELCRGVFVSGLSAAQFARPDGVDRLRTLAEDPDEDPLLLSAADPAFVAPALGLPFPGGQTLARRSQNHVVLVQGQVVLTSETLGRRVYVADGDPAVQRGWIRRLVGLLDRGRPALRIHQLQGEPALRSPLRPLFEEEGFRPDGSVLERRRF